MRIALVIMANILVIVVSVMGVHEFHGLRRFVSFTVPFTDKMIAAGVIDGNNRDRILKEERLNHYIGILLCAAVCGMLAAFMAGISAIAVLAVSVIVQLIALKPESGESEETRNQYFNAHKKDMDVLKYHGYLESLGGTDGSGV